MQSVSLLSQIADLHASQACHLLTVRSPYLFIGTETSVPWNFYHGILHFAHSALAAQPPCWYITLRSSLALPTLPPSNITLHTATEFTMSSPPPLLQLQAQAGRGAHPVAIQSRSKSKSGSSDSLDSLSSSNSSNTRKASLDIVRCSRCQRSLSIEAAGPACQSGCIRFGLNSYYCTRCATVVGFVK